MSSLRQRLPCLVAAWLMCQLGAFAAAPIEVAARGLIASGEVCDCPAGEPGQFCPMHKSPNAPHHEELDLPSLQDACEPLDAALLSLTWGAGLMPALSVADPAFVRLPLPVTFDSSASRSELPEAPPPRA